MAYGILQLIKCIYLAKWTTDQQILWKCYPFSRKEHKTVMSEKDVQSKRSGYNVCHNNYSYICDWWAELSLQCTPHGPIAGRFDIGPIQWFGACYFCTVGNIPGKATWWSVSGTSSGISCVFCDLLRLNVCSCLVDDLHFVDFLECFAFRLALECDDVNTVAFSQRLAVFGAVLADGF